MTNYPVRVRLRHCVSLLVQLQLFITFQFFVPRAKPAVTLEDKEEENEPACKQQR